jgi:hypothetical protein
MFRQTVTAVFRALSKLKKEAVISFESVTLVSTEKNKA